MAPILWLIVSFGLKFYLRYFNTYRAPYGSLRAVIILMLGFYLTGISVLVGAEINAAVDIKELKEVNEVKEAKEQRYANRHCLPQSPRNSHRSSFLVRCPRAQNTASVVGTLYRSLRSRQRFDCLCSGGSGSNWLIAARTGLAHGLECFGRGHERDGF